MAEELVRQCSWCRRVHDPETGEWVPCADIVEGATHTICEECFEKLMKGGEFDSGRRKGGRKKGENPMQLAGMTIVDVRTSTPQERKAMMWHENFIVIELEGGAMLFASSDNEMNDPGSLHVNQGGRIWTLVPQQKGR